MAATRKINPVQCPNCGCKVDAVTSLGHRSLPTDGDLTICVECACLLEFGENLTVHLPSREVLRRAMKSNEKLAYAMKFIRMKHAGWDNFFGDKKTQKKRNSA